MAASGAHQYEDINETKNSGSRQEYLFYRRKYKGRSKQSRSYEADSPSDQFAAAEEEMGAIEPTCAECRSVSTVANDLKPIALTARLLGFFQPQDLECVNQKQRLF